MDILPACDIKQQFDDSGPITSRGLQPWGGEVAVVPWNGGLAIIELPTHEPVKSMTLLRHVKGDVFRRVREKDDDALGEVIRFERGDAGEVTRFWQHSHPFQRLELM